MARKEVYSQTVINQALKEFLDTGNYRMAARAIGVPEGTVRGWAKKYDWDSLQARVQSEVEARMATESAKRQSDVRSLALEIQLLSLQHLHTKMQAEQVKADFARVAEAMGRILAGTRDTETEDVSHEDALKELE